MLYLSLMKYKHSYLVSIQYLGFRFHGWQKQKNVMSLHEMIDKTLGFILSDIDFKTLGSGRTDSKVSANKYYFQLFLHELIDNVGFIDAFNSNASSDLKVLKNHPFAASLLVGFEDDLDIELMKQGALLFEGTHYFQKYCTEPTKVTTFKRKILSCIIDENRILTANFFPEKSYVLKVKCKGFLRYQIRLMMGVLVELGKHHVTLDYIQESLRETNDAKPLRTIAPGSGLQLYDVIFE